MNIYLLIIIIFLILSYLIGFISDYLNVKNMSEVLPKEFEGYYDAEKYKKSQNYLKDKTNFSFISSLFVLVTGIVFILAGGFNFVDKFARSFGYGEIVSGMIFISVLMLLLNIIKIPFSAYNTFVIEEKYGFNKTTIKTFISDIIKNNLLLILIGLPIFAVIVWFFIGI